MTQMITRHYRSFEDARNVVVRLSRDGIPAERVGLVGRQEGGDDNTAAAAGVGGAAGAATGAVLSLGALTLPGVGPVIAAGWFLGGALVGALAGGLGGALIDAGVPQTDAERHAEAVNSGSALVTVAAETEEIGRVEAIMDSALPLPEPASAPSGITDKKRNPPDLSKVVS